MSSSATQPLFRDLTAEDPDPEVTQIESLCMNCQANGMTRLLLTRIPYYKNVVLMSFSCEECGFENNEIQPGGAYPDYGVKYVLQVDSSVDLNRQVVKSDYCSIRIPEVDFEIPAQSQKGEVTTVEGILRRCAAGLLQDQPARRLEHPAEAEQIDQFVDKLNKLASMEGGKFTLELTDISGNSFIENPAAPRPDPRCSRVEFTRDTQQDHELGIFTRDEVRQVSDVPNPSLLTPCDVTEGSYSQLTSDEVITFNTNCPDCNAPCTTNMKLTHIPHFKEVVIMATVCDACGHKTNEVKSGGGIEPQGVRFEVRLASKDDLSRDILKSETCALVIPSLELEVGGKALGGRFTTVEGVVAATRDQLLGAPGVGGDGGGGQGVVEFCSKLNEVLECKLPVTLILDDPAGNSYVQSLNDEDPNKPDDGLKITRYDRTFEQNEELGLNDMKTENYEVGS